MLKGDSGRSVSHMTLNTGAVVNKIREVLWFDSLIYVSCSIHICEISSVVL